MGTDEDLVRGLPAEGDEPRQSGLLRKAGVAVAGVVVILVGIPLIPLFGPGWLIVFTGLAILASEFEWADRMRERIRTKFRSIVGRHDARNTD